MRLKNLLALTALACVLYAAGPVSAEEQTYLDRRLAQMDEELDLTVEQSTQVRQILDETFARIAVDRQQLQGDPKALQDAVGKSIRDADKQIDKILTDDQRERFVEFRKTGRADIMTISLQERLDLSPSQTADVYEILFETEQKMVEMRDEMRNSGRGGPGGGGMSKMRDIMEDADEKIEKVLTDEQQAVYQEIKDERRTQMRERKGERGGGRGGGGGGFGRP